MRQKILTAFLIIYIGGAFVDYLEREGIKKGLWDNIFWRDGGPPIVSLASGLFWPIHLFSTIAPTKTTAEQLVEMLHSGNNYPSCSTEGCIQDITAKGNTVIATYTLPRSSSELPQVMFVERAATAEKIRPTALRDICGAAGANFPDRTMKWASHYYTKDGKFLASILVTMNECQNK